MMQAVLNGIIKHLITVSHTVFIQSGFPGAPPPPLKLATLPPPPPGNPDILATMLMPMVMLVTVFSTVLLY